MPSQSRAASASQYCCTILLLSSTLTAPPWGCAPDPSALGSLALARSPRSLRSRDVGEEDGRVALLENQGAHLRAIMKGGKFFKNELG